MVHVCKEDGQLNQIGCGAADGVKGNIQIFKYLGCLCLKIIPPDNFAVLIKCGLARDENYVPSAYVNNVRITGWRAKFRGVYTSN